MRVSPLMPLALLLLLSLIHITTGTIIISNCTEAEEVNIKPPLAAINDLGFNLLRELRIKYRNHAVSPLSMWIVLSFLSVGAEGETLAQILHVLGLKDKKGVLYLSKNVSTRYFEDIGSNNTKITLKDAVQIFLKKNTDLNNCQTQLSPIITRVDFANGEKTSEVINDFVNKSTGGLIQSITEPNIITPESYMILVNALYFKGVWKFKFQKEFTEMKEFYVSPGRPVMTEMMQGKMLIKNGVSEDLHATVLQLPYSDNLVFMSIFLPLEEGFPALSLTLHSLSHTLVETTLNELSTSICTVSMPKLRMVSNIHKKITEALQRLGIKDAFEAILADFSSFQENLYVEDSLHKTVFEVDEEGSEGGSMARGGAIKRIILNRPFVFAIHTADVVFLTGVYMKPFTTRIP